MPKVEPITEELENKPRPGAHSPRAFCERVGTTKN